MSFSSRRFFGNAAGAPGNHSYNLSFNDFQNLCIQFVFSSKYQCIYIATYQHLRYPWISVHPPSLIYDVLGGHDRASWDMHMEDRIGWTQRCTWRPWSCELGGCNRASLDIHLVAVIERVWRCTWRLWSSEFGDALGGRDEVRLDEYLEAVDGRLARCWDSIHQLVNSQPWECDNVTFPLSSQGELADGGRLCREVRRMLKLHSVVNSYSWEWREDKQSWVDAVLGVRCTRCQLLIMSWRDGEGWLTFVFCDDGWVVDEKERDGGWSWEWYGGYERIWEIRGTTCLIRLGRPCIGVSSRRIGTRTCHMGDGQLTRTQNSLSPSFSWWFPPIFHFLVLNSTIT